MGQITNRNTKFQLEAQGRGGTYQISTTTSSVTAATLGSGSASISLKANGIGTTFPNTIVDVIRLPSGTNPIRLSTITGTPQTANFPFVLAYIYELGTQNITTTGDQFTHHAATFPLLRTQMGVSQAVSLLPMIQVTTATTVTAAVLTMKNVANTAGYTDQDGNVTVGTRTHTMPSAATAINSCYFLPLENGDTGIRDITAIQTNTAATAGAARIWGVEFLWFFGNAPYGNSAMTADGVFQRLTMPDLRPAVATSGTVNAKLVLITLNTATSVNFSGTVTTVADI